MWERQGLIREGAQSVHVTESGEWTVRRKGEKGKKTPNTAPLKTFSKGTQTRDLFSPSWKNMECLTFHFPPLEVLVFREG